MKKVIATSAAPAAIGTYSQAVTHQGVLYISGQIPLDPESMEIQSGDIRAQIVRVFDNLVAICDAADTDLSHALKLNIYLTDLKNFAILNEVMSQYVPEPFPARAAVEVSALPKGVDVEIDAMVSVAVE
ncbi:MAG: Rid family detoxifying hydrolase [Pseudomonadales bacterium]|jgi:reactive intermediate/imine deaminase|nr:Rid family detoxifying hydrolase [Pseudomonadales bacterium]MDG1442552.1 Rid family detoxifying hydrolase [Pseudomonadales bacterium]